MITILRKSPLYFYDSAGLDFLRTYKTFAMAENKKTFHLALAILFQLSRGVAPS